MQKKKFITFMLLMFVYYGILAQDSCGDRGDPGDGFSCFGGCNGGGVKRVSIQIVVPKDLNAIIVPKVYDTSIKQGSIKENLPYKILFENDPEFPIASTQEMHYLYFLLYS